MKRSLFTSLLVLLGFQAVVSQSITAKIIDSKSGESIPYASVKVSESDFVVSNSEGYFTVPDNKSADDSILLVSYLGYAHRQITVKELKNQQFIVRLEPGAFELEAVKVSNVKPDPYSIMAEVKKNLARNYKRDEQPSKK